MAGCERVDLPDSVPEDLRAFINGTQGWTKLHYASYLGDCDLVSSILHEGVDIDFTAERGTGKYKCKSIDAVKIKENTSSWKKDLDRENVVNVISLLQAAMNPFQLHLAMANPYLYQQAWPPEIRDGLFMTLLSHHAAQEGKSAADSPLAMFFNGGECDVWHIILSFMADHRDVPRLRKKLAEDSSTAHAQEAARVRQAPLEEMLVAP